MSPTMPRTYLLTWNPAQSSTEKIEAAWKRQCVGETPRPVNWSCGRTKSIPVGARVFLHRQREEPRGIVAAGWVNRVRLNQPHWDAAKAKRGEVTNYVDWQVDAVVEGFGYDPNYPPLQVHLLIEGPLHDDISWNHLQGSGTSISDTAAAELERLWFRHIGQEAAVSAQDEDLSATENNVIQRLIWSRSRESAMRKAKIRQALSCSPDGKLRCEVPGCGFCFEDVYGQVGQGYAHVHHLDALAEHDGPVTTTLADLAIVCANCHAMIHRGNECRPLDGLIRTRLSRE
jgi:hypothetical protein